MIKAHRMIGVHLKWSDKVAVKVTNVHRFVDVDGALVEQHMVVRS